MATVYIPPPLQSLSGGVTQVTIKATSVRQIVERVDALNPGMRAARLDDDEFHPPLAVAVDGEVSVLGLVERVEEDCEVHFLPALGGGNGGC
jgi:molybdopterin synthase sulfur carrier subunit